MYHIGAMSEVVRVLFSEDGYTVIFPSTKLEIVDILESIQAYKCNALSGLPKILTSFINHPARKSYDLSSLIVCGCAGQLVTADMVQRFKDELKIRAFFIAYGSTETNGGIISLILLRNFNPDTFQTRVGKPQAYYECKIVDSEGHVVPINEEGELHMRGANITRGYWNDEEKTKEAFDVNGWYNTGDFFSMDQGNLSQYKLEQVYKFTLMTFYLFVKRVTFTSKVEEKSLLQLKARV
jgi:fatty-acyl-CoA synthase